MKYNFCERSELETNADLGGYGQAQYAEQEGMETGKFDHNTVREELNFGGLIED